MNPSSRSWQSLSAELTWFHDGATWRVTAWPEVRFLRRDDTDWVPAYPDEQAFASAARSLTPEGWAAYLEYVPPTERSLIEQFRFGRVAALYLITICPALLTDLQDTPALANFLSNHRLLRESEKCGWSEIAAVHERNGIFGVLEWLGIPASRQTLTILRNIVDPDIPRKLLEPLRSLLWEPAAIVILQKVPGMTDRELARYCHALAA